MVFVGTDTVWKILTCGIPMKNLIYTLSTKRPNKYPYRKSTIFLIVTIYRLSTAIIYSTVYRLWRSLLSPTYSAPVCMDSARTPRELESCQDGRDTTVTAARSPCGVCAESAHFLLGHSDSTRTSPSRFSICSDTQISPS